MCKSQWWALLGAGYIVAGWLLIYAVSPRQRRVRTRTRGRHR